MESAKTSPQLLELLPNKSLPVFAIAAFFEESFSIDWIVELTEKKASEILSYFERGMQDGILTKEAPGVFNFANIKVRDKFRDYYNKADKEKYHGMIASILVGELPDDDIKLRALETHLLHIHNNEEYCSLLIMAGDANRKKFRSERALECYAKVLEDLSSVHNEKADYLFAKSAINYSKVSMAKHQTTKVLSLLDEAIRREKKCNNKAFKSHLKMQLAKNLWLRSEFTSALKHFNEAKSIAEKLDDPKLLRSVEVFRVFFLIWQGRFNEAVRIHEKHIPDVWEYPKGQFPLYAAQTVGYCYTQIGEITHGIGLLDTLRLHCLEKGEKYVAAHAGVTIGNAFLDVESFDEALKWLHWSLDEATQEQNEWTLIWAELMLSYAYYRKHIITKSVKYLNDFVIHSKRAQVNVRPYPYHLDLCWAIEKGELPHIQGLSFKEELQNALKGKNVFTKGIAYRYRALVQRREGESNKNIINSLKISLNYLEESGHQFGIAKTRLELARQYMMLGNKNKSTKLTLLSSTILSPYNESLIPDDLRVLVKDTRAKEYLFKEILELSRKLSTARSNKDLIQNIISTVTRIIGAERGAIFLLSSDTHGQKPIFQLRASRNLTPDEINKPNFEGALNIIEKVASTGKGMVKQNLTNKNTISHAFQHIRSCICVPMIIRGEVLGVIYYDNRLLSGAFREDDLYILSYFAVQAALALDNAIAHDKINRFEQKAKIEHRTYEDSLLQSGHFDQIIGESPALKRLLVQVDQVARTDATVLLIGETGVGKDLLAQSIHRESPRGKKRLLVVNCNALSENLIFSELFGHEAGAFTGATQQRIGRFELANGGTLFLDEIGELPAEFQVRLLRVLETKEFERVGGNETIKSDFRLIVATNRDLENEVKVNNFRHDLYYRISGYPIYVPPLRERSHDIPIIARHFLKIYKEMNKKEFNGISDEIIEKLTQYDWPGNVRELKNVIEWGAILSNEPLFQLPERFIRNSNSTYLKENANTLRDNEYHHILSVLNRTGWKVRGRKGAAEILDVPPSTLDSKMKKLGISRPKNFKKGQKR
jgi:formate hydrogenlyase transcriptional activator